MTVYTAVPADRWRRRGRGSSSQVKSFGRPGETADETRDAIAIWDIRQACCVIIEFAHDSGEQIAQLEQSPVDAFFLGDHPIDAGPKLVLDLPRDPVSPNLLKAELLEAELRLVEAKERIRRQQEIVSRLAHRAMPNMRRSRTGASQLVS